MRRLSRGLKWTPAFATVFLLCSGLSREARAATQCINPGAPAPLEFCVKDDGTPAVWVAQPNGRTYQYYGDDDWGSVIWLDKNDASTRYVSEYATQYLGGLSSVTPVSNTLTGTGTSADPYVIATVFDLGASGVRVTQTFSYIDGDRTMRKRWALANTGATTYADSRFFHGGDTYFGGSDFARSWYDADNHMVYVTNPDFSNSGLMGFYANPATPSAAYFGGGYHFGQFATLGYDVNSGALIEPQLPSTADSNFVDAGYQLQWDRASLAPGQTWNIEAFETWSAPGGLQVLSPADDFVLAGVTVRKTFKVHNLTSNPLSVTLAAISAPSGWTVSLPDGGSIDLDPQESGEVAVDITVPANAPVGTSRDITFTATAGAETGVGSTRLSILQADYTLLPTTLEYLAGGDLTVTLSNGANGSPVEMGQIAGSNTLAAPFSITADSCSNATVAASASCSITVHFAPPNGNPVNDTFDWPILAPVITSQTITVSGNPAPATHAVQTSAGAGGSIGPTSAVINHGATTTFTVTPAVGYSIASVTGCGGALAANIYTTGAITAACTVTASFSLNTYAVSASAGPGGGIDPSNIMVSHGSTTSFTVTPNAGFSIAVPGVQGCGGSLTGNTYTTGTITGACAVSASFILNQYLLTVTAGAGGRAEPGSTIVGYGSSTSFTITPDAGYTITGVTGCGGTLNGTTYTTAIVTSSCAITAGFAITPPTFDPASPPAHEINATSLITQLPQSIAPRAFDTNGEELAVTLVGGQTQYLPGEYTLTWRAVDDRGVESTVQQILRIWPTVSVGPDVSLGFVQGNSTSFRIVLNGVAPQTPFTVGYTVSGHLTDHDLESGNVQFGAGETEKEVFFAVMATPALGTPDQDIEVELNEEVNRGTRRHLTVHLLAQNAAPVVVLAARQAEEIVSVFNRTGAPVTILADIRDPNSADTHTVEWISPSGAAVTAIGSKLTLQADSLPAGVHRFEAIVTDHGTPALSTRGVLDIVLAEAETSLPTGATDWADNGLPDHVDYNPPQRNVLPEHAHDLTQFLIEGDPGLRLSLGPHALQEQRFQAELLSNSIGADTVTNVGGYFDFTVGDLPAVGQSVNVVIPQQAPIPANPVYRKYDLVTQRWNTFIENSNNALASAPGAEGLCPPPGSDAFRPGLNPGDWCVRLTLSDGGPNDGDGQENGVVVDPSGVGTFATVVVTTSGKGGGGAVDPLWLLLGSALVALRRRSRGLILVAAIAGSATASAQNTWYGGLQLGPARGDISASDVNARLADAGYDATAAFTDLNRNAWRIYAGYQLSPYVGIEGGYTDLGEVRTRLEGNVADIDAFLASANELHPHSAQGFELSVHGRYPLTPRISLGARGGLLRWDSRYRARNVDGEFNRLKDEGMDAFLGIGVDFAVYRDWSLGVDWTNYRINGESIGFTGFGVSYRLK